MLNYFILGKTSTHRKIRCMNSTRNSHSYISHQQGLDFGGGDGGGGGGVTVFLNKLNVHRPLAVVSYVQKVKDHLHTNS